MTSAVIGLSNKGFILSISPMLFLPVFLFSILFVVSEANALPHAISVVGEFEGKFDLKSINTVGDYTISGDTNTFVLVGTFENDGLDRFNPNCQKIIAYLVLENQETKINLDYTGKNCRYGLFSYVIGTFEVTNSEGEYEIKSGKGRITFVADHHSNNVSGHLKGSFE